MEQNELSLAEQLDLLSKEIAAEVIFEDPDGILMKLNRLSSLLGMSSHTVALSERLYNEKLGELILMKEYKGLGATDKKILFGSLASKEIEFMTKADRLNRACTHGCDSLRSMLSYLKSEMNNLK